MANLSTAEHARTAAEHLNAVAARYERIGQWTDHDSAMAVYHLCEALGLEIPDTYADLVTDELAAIEAESAVNDADYDRSRRASYIGAGR